MNNVRAGRSSKETEDFPDALYAAICSSRRSFALCWKGIETTEEGVGEGAELMLVVTSCESAFYHMRDEKNPARRSD